MASKSSRRSSETNTARQAPATAVPTSTAAAATPGREAPAANPRPSSDEIARRAYERWERAGARHGDDQNHWFEAERELAQSAGDNGQETRREMA